MDGALNPSEEIEVTLIQRDVNDLVRALLGPKDHPVAGGILPFVTIALAGLVTEESFRYLSKARSGSPLHPPESDLFAMYGQHVTKTRARIKLFDDTDGYAEGLVEALEIAHAKSVEWFSEPHRGFFRSWIRRVQPDLGIFFTGESLIATTHTILPSIGLTLDELRTITPKDLQSLDKRLFAFSYQLGVYLGRLATLFASFGKYVEVEPEPITTDFGLSHNDFIGAKFYRLALGALRPTRPEYVGAVVMALAQINTALLILPRLLGLQSNLLVRMRVLTTYHARNALDASVPHLMCRMPAFSEAERAALQSRQLRNICAHYGLGYVANSAIGANDPFGAALEGITSTSRDDLCATFELWLSAAAAILNEHLTKGALAPARALLGDRS